MKRTSDSSLTNDGRRGDDADDAVLQLVEYCLDQFEAHGRDVVLEVCREHPAHAEAVVRRIDHLRRLGFITIAASPEIPDKLGDFRLLSVIGRGGMGVVYLAEQISLKRRVALKVMRAAHLADSVDRERFRREIDAIARLQHTGIVPIYAVGEDAGTPFFAMEYVEGSSLGDIVRALATRRPEGLSGLDMAKAVGAEISGDDSACPPAFRGTWWQSCVRLMIEAARAVGHAHDRGVVHRDIKPSNLMVRTDGRVALLDFGLAGLSDGQTLTRTGGLLGSLPYIAPEILRADVGAVAGPKTDVYALGVTLCEVLTLTSPFLGANADETRARILSGALPQIRKKNEAVPIDLEAVCRRAVESSAKARYGSALEFAADLEALLEGRPVTARRPGPIQNTARFARRHPTACVAAGFALLIVIGGPLLFAIQKQRNLEDVKRALDRAEAARDSAEKQRRYAKDTVDRMLIEVTQQRFIDIPELEELRRRLLNKGAMMYEMIAKEESEDDRGAVTRAMALSELGFLSSDLGEFDKAKAVLMEALDLAGSVKDPSALAEAETVRRIAHSRLAIVEKWLGEWTSAEKSFLAAVEASRRCIASKSADIADLRLYAQDLENYALVLARLGRLPEALQHLTEVSRVQNDAIEKGAHPDEFEVSSTLSNLASVYAEMGDAAKAEDHYRRAIATDEKSRERRAGDFGWIEHVSIGLGAMARFLLENRREAEALPFAQRALDEAMVVVHEKPFVPRFAATECTARHTLASILNSLGRADEADTILAPAVATSSDLIHRFPTSGDFKQCAVAVHVLRATMRQKKNPDAALEDFDRAIRLIDDLLRQRPDDPGLIRNLAAALGSSAQIRVTRGERKEAAPLFDRAVSAWCRFVARPEGPKIGGSRLVVIAAHRTRNQIALDEPEAAEASADLLAKESTWPALLAAVFAYADVVTFVRKDDDRSVADREKHVTSLIHRAAQALTAAKDVGLPTSMDLRKEPLLAPIIDAPEIKEVLSQIH